MTKNTEKLYTLTPMTKSVKDLLVWAVRNYTENVHTTPKERAALRQLMAEFELDWHQDSLEEFQ